MIPMHRNKPILNCMFNVYLKLNIQAMHECKQERSIPPFYQTWKIMVIMTQCTYTKLSLEASLMKVTKVNLNHSFERFQSKPQSGQELKTPINLFFKI